MNLLIWQVAVVVCFVKLACCGVVEISPRNINVMQTVMDKEPSDLCPITNSRIATHLPHPEDCSRFYICENGVPHLKKCPNGLHFNMKLQACDYPHTAGCDKDAVEKEKGRIAEEKFDTCPEKNSKFPVYIPDSDDCSRFYICDNGIPHPKKCLPGLHFNPKINACDYPKNAKCDTDAAEKEKGRIAKGEFDTCPEKNSKIPVYIPDPDDCSRFYICDNGIPHPKKCLPGLHFNPKINACDYPKNAKCDTDADDKTKGRITDDDVGECPKENSIFPVYLPHPDDCNKFYICDSGSPKLKECFSGLHFNPKLNACDYPENVGCESDEQRARISESSSAMCRVDDATLSEYFPHPEDCNKFYVCYKGLALLQKCPPGLHFNPKLIVCDYPENVKCETGDSMMLRGRPFNDANSLSCPDDFPGIPTLYPHPTECDMFYECHHGKPVLKSCDPGQNFNDEIQACDNNENTVCGKEMTLAFAGVESPFCPSVDGKIPIFYRDSTNCSIYYMCSNGLAYKFVCPARLHFNVRKRICDYEENAKCKTNA